MYEGSPYCAFCGMVLPKPWWDEARAEAEVEVDEDLEADPDSTFTYDPHFVKIEDLEWMSDVRVISENSECTDIERVFVSGPCTDVGSKDWNPGEFEALPGDDPKFPPLPPGHDKLVVATYTWVSGSPIVFPFHHVCYDVVLREVIRHHTGEGTIDNEVLYESMKRFSPFTTNRATSLEGLDYGQISEYREEFFWVQRGTEAFALSPEPDQLITDVYSSLPRSGGMVRHNWTPQTVTTKGSGAFATLPTEIILDIMLMLPLDALANIRACSKNLYGIGLIDGLWKRRLKLDMPWIYDVPELIWQRDLDWAASYKTLLQNIPTRREKVYLHLANRRRIWTICTPIVDLYEVLLREKHRTVASPDCQMLEKAICSPMPPLIWPLPSEPTTSILPMMRNITPDDGRRLILDIFWSTEGHLMGFGINHFQGQEHPDLLEAIVVGDKTRFARKDSRIIDKNSWLIGIKVTVKEDRLNINNEWRSDWHCVGVELWSRDTGKTIQLGQADGAQRLFIISKDHVLVGMKLQWSASRGISKIGLLQLPLTAGTWMHKDFLTSHERMVDVSNRTILHAWKDRILPAGADISELVCASPSDRSKFEIEPVDALMFGTNEEELSAITSFSVDIDIGAFRVGYADGSVKSIGPSSTTMRRVDINGASGERIIEIGLTFRRDICSFSIRTNRGRGTGVQIYSTPLARSIHLTPPADKFVAGIYCHWKPASRLHSSARLEFCGLILLPNSQCKPP